MQVQDVARDAIAATNCRANLLLVARWTSLRYQEIAAKFRLRHLRRVGETVVPGSVTSGTATSTRGSDTIVGNAAAHTAWAAIHADLDSGRYAFRGATVWYTVVGITASGDLRLAAAYAEDSVTAGAYTLAVRYARVASGANFITAVGLPRLQRPLRDGSLTRFMDLEPTRSRVSTPEHWVETTRDLDGARRIEVYPYCAVAELVTYLYYADAPMLKPRDILPSGIDGALLKEGVLVDCFRWEAGEAIRAGSVDQAGYWRNESRAQETRWQDLMGQIAQGDQGADDVDFLLLLRPGEIESRDIRTAYEQVWSRY